MPFGVDDAFLVAGTLLGGAGALGTSPAEKATQEALNKLESGQSWLKSTPFSKEEIMGTLLPLVQKMYRGAADVVAGRAGSAMSESGVAKGQDFVQMYMQSLAPVIAGGENAAAQSVSEFGKWFSALDSESKNRFLQSIQLELQGAGNLPDMNTFQRLVTGALSGLNLGATAGANYNEGQALLKKANSIDTSVTELSNKALIDTIEDPNKFQYYG